VTRATDAGPRAVIGVAVPVPGLGLLSYRVPADVATPQKGARVTVPLGARHVTGVVVEPHAEPPAGAKLKDVIAVIDAEPFLPSIVVDLAMWVGEYYAAGPGDALAIAMPPSARGGKRSSFRTRLVAELVAGSEESALGKAPGDRRSTLPIRGERQRAVLEQLRAAGQPVAVSEIEPRGAALATVRSLERLGLVAVRDEVVERDPFASTGSAAAPWSVAAGAGSDRPLTVEQQAAFDRLDASVQAGRFRVTLLQGVTGSGKTEIYLQLARRVVAAGRRVLMLVPEIGLTPAMAGVFRARFGSRVAIQHSGLSAGERHDQWHRIRRGEVDIVVGTRSAVFAPIEQVGLIIVDEEHDSSYKQDETPRYNGRDVAVVRGRAAGAVVLLGSATPSLESGANVEAGRYDRLLLTQRIFDRPLAAVRVVDMRLEYAAHGPDVILSAPLIDAIGARLERHEQTVVLLNRRGFATVVFCRQCGATMECPHCSIALTFHRARRQLRCHYCDYSAPVPRTCETCGGEYLEQSGFGTERIEAELAARFPLARIARVDRDTIRRRGEITRVLDEVARGRIDVLVGTQMIAKGHDFPAVTLVGVVSADVGLGAGDFRASERTFQLLTQVVGRAGRGTVPGEAIIQTVYPEHYSIRAAAAQDYAAFFTREREFRDKMQYPPSVSLINVIVKHASAGRAMEDAADLAGRVRQRLPRGRVLGPAPAFLSRLKDEHRVQFFLKGMARHALRKAILAALDERPDLRKRVVIDVDPTSVS
jgi:primosomal protein N' (replication factor Y)